MTRPALFVGSSSEGLPIARAVKVVLDDACEVTIWNEGVFSLTTGWLEALVRDLPRFDFAVLVLTADDMTVSRGAERAAVRDNVLFELGLCIGSLGRDRTYMVYDRTNKPTLPTDLDGISAATFEPYRDGNLIAALGTPCERIRHAVEQLGIRKDKGFRDLEKATHGVESVNATMQQLLRLLARSRKVELDIIATQFGPMINPQQLQKMKQDLADLEQTLGEEHTPSELRPIRTGQSSPNYLVQRSLPDLSPVHHHQRVPPRAPPAAPAGPADHLGGGGPRAGANGGDEPAGSRQPQADHHRAGGRRGPAGGDRRCVLTPPHRSSPQRNAGTS